MKAVILFVLIAAWAQTGAASSFQVRCGADLLDSSGRKQIVKGAGSPHFMNTSSEFSNSETTVEIGPFTLTGKVWVGKPLGSSSTEPSFIMYLYRGNPIGGEVDSMSIQGLDLENRPANVPLTLFKTEFLMNTNSEFTLGGEKISRIDYSCSVIKVSE